MKEQLNFVFVSLQRINTDRDSTSTNIAKELAKKHRVLYINPPIDKRTYYFGNVDRYTEKHIQLIKTGRGENLEQVAENLWILNPLTLVNSINWIPFTRVFSCFNKHNNVRLAKEVKQIFDRIGFTNVILINDKDIYKGFYLKELLSPLLYVYLDRDYIVGMGYWKKHGSKLEPILMEKADLIVCNSPGFTERAKTFNPNSFYIGNGCNLQLFDIDKHFACPDDMKPLKDHPVIGYVGALLALRLDIDLLVHLAKAKPEWNLVLIGAEDEAFASSELHQLSNVYFLGKKDSRDVPAYIVCFDCCINPQVVNDITNDNYPLKIDEYIAMGRPTVATRTNVMEQVFSPVVRLASDVGEFIQEIEASLNEKDHDKVRERVRLARSHSWQNITDNMLHIVNGHVKIK